MSALDVLFADNLPVSAPWAIDDDEWFLTNTSRSHRLRPAFPDEPQDSHLRAGDHPDDFTTFVIVRQIWPGYRPRNAVKLRRASAVDKQPRCRQIGRK
jgi:hypothetical protein